MTYFPVKNVNKHGFFEILSPPIDFTSSQFPAYEKRKKKGVLKSFAKIIGKQLCRSLVFRSVAFSKSDFSTDVFLYILQKF